MDYQLPAWYIVQLKDRSRVVMLNMTKFSTNSVCLYARSMNGRETPVVGLLTSHYSGR
jgi:hypothetical protein